MFRFSSDYSRPTKRIPPMQFLIVLCAMIFGRGDNYFFILYLIILELIYFGLKESLNRGQVDDHKTKMRKYALRSARIYLSPYNDIWSNLRLSNKKCYIKLGTTPDDIVCGEKIDFKRKFRVITSNVHSYEDLWNMFCKYFNHQKTYDDLVKDCFKYRVIIEESLSPKDENVITNSPYEQNATPLKPINELIKVDFEEKQENKKEETEQTENIENKIDINNCSEIELTELPGISIVMAKKAIKKRDEINGFKSKKEFYQFLNLKNHIQTQLENRICINNKKGDLKEITKNIERIVDI